MTEATIDGTELKPLDPQDDPLGGLTPYGNVFVMHWRADRSGFGSDGNWGTETVEFAHSGGTRGEVLEQVAAEIVRQDADDRFDWERSFGEIREVTLVSSERIDAGDLEGTMAFRLRREAREREARRKALAAERAKDSEKERRRVAYEELRAEFGGDRCVPEPSPRR